MRLLSRDARKLATQLLCGDGNIPGPWEGGVQFYIAYQTKKPKTFKMKMDSITLSIFCKIM